MGLDGVALLWFEWENSRRLVTRWEELKAMVLRHFRPIKQGSLCEQWLSVEQKGTVEEYRNFFIQYAAPVEGLTEEVLLASFIKGLRRKSQKSKEFMDLAL